MVNEPIIIMRGGDFCMSFAVVHMGKYGKSAIKGMQIHEQREKESKTNSDIDKTKSHENYDLHNTENINFNSKINEIIKDNVESKRVIKDDAVVMCELVISSDHEFFKSLEPEREKEFFEKSYEFFKERYEEKNIISAIVHKDEKTPHMHLNLVPVMKDKNKGITKLCAKELFDKIELKTLQNIMVKEN
jgi:predicted nucleotidyltransferase